MSSFNRGEFMEEYVVEEVNKSGEEAAAVEVEARPKAGAHAEAEAQPEAGAEEGAHAEAEAEAQPEAGAEAGARAEAEAQPEAGAEAGAHAEAEAHPEAEAEAEAAKGPRTIHHRPRKEADGPWREDYLYPGRLSYKPDPDLAPEPYRVGSRFNLDQHDIHKLLLGCPKYHSLAAMAVAVIQFEDIILINTKDIVEDEGDAKEIKLQKEAIKKQRKLWKKEIIVDVSNLFSSFLTEFVFDNIIFYTKLFR
jgi:hypothetical protein